MGASVKITDRDKGWKDFFKAVAAVKGDRSVRVGVLSDTEKGAEQYPEGGLTVAEVAAVMEYGTEDGRIPERSFLRSTFDEERDAIAVLIAKMLVKMVTGGISPDQALNLIGMYLANATKKKITSGEGVPPPLAQSTIDRKGSSRPLVDTGRLLGAITWEIVEGKGGGDAA